jgi:hypothetical protein
MGIAGAAFGASNALEEIVAKRILQQKLEQEVAERQQRMAMEQSRIEEGKRQFDVEAGQRTRQLDAQDTDRRARSNQAGVRRMLGEALVQGDGPMQSQDRRGLAALQVEAGDAPTLLNEPKPERDPIADHEAKLRLEAKYRPAPKPERDPIADHEAKARIDAKYRRPENSAAPKLPVTMATAVAAAQTSLAGLDRLERLYSDDKVGPLAGRYNKVERSAPSVIGGLMPDAPKDFEEFAAESATLKNQVIQAITGAAVGVKEQERIMGQIPDVTNMPSVWKARAKATRRNLQELMANQTQMGTGAAEVAPGSSVNASAPDAPQEIVYQRDPNTGKLVRVGG